ncbi:MAG: chromosome segregation protein SMC [Alphaproteobacteria bacterium]|nr:chromosome segregation protein SMC [Alphaproteobacteria bacterium]
MKFSRLRLVGFKSFVEPTDLPIEQGLTGIVGPNGCGKSNLLEALRWVMGENSAKSMRGGAMDDVIFAGTNSRPSRNTAEVSLVIDNTARAVPAAYNENEAVEITRRIEREMGSIYKINGRDVRARDVQLFFADISSGAHSPALVRQGQIGTLINAKPIARRAILEEAAGISGLHARRHEAELKLNAAQTNLSRVSDVIQEIEQQLANLKRQARQAARYRNLSGHIQRAEALALYVRWQLASTSAAAAEEELARIRLQVEELTLRAAQASNAVLESDEKLPALRQEAAERSAALQRLTAERMSLDGEEARAKAAAERLNARLAQIVEDQARETARVDDARTMMAQLEHERTELEGHAAGEAEATAQAADALRVAEEAMREAEGLSDKTTAEFAEAKSRRAELERRVGDGQRAAARLRGELDNIASEIERLAREAATAPAVEDAELRVAAAVTGAEASKSTHAHSEDALRAARDAENAKRQSAEAAERDLERLKAEARALSEMLATGVGEGFVPVIDLVHVTPGFEAALGAALGDDLNVPVDAAAPIFWHELPPLDPSQPLPSGVQSLSDLVQAPEALSRRLLQIGVVEREQGAALQSRLLPGQCLVTREGDLWRWDGFTTTAEAPTAAAVRLRQRNRLADLEGTVASAEAHVAELRSIHQDAREAREAAEITERTVRNAWRQAESEATAARTTLAEAEKRHAQTAARVQSLNERHQALTQDEREAQERSVQLGSEIDALPLLADFEARLAAAREELTAARAGYTNAKARHDSVEREARARRQRVQAIASDLEAWQARIATASGQIEALGAREGEARAELAALEHVPAEIAEKRAKLFELLAAAEAARKDASDALAQAESGLKAAQSASRVADHDLSHAREERARCEAVLAAQRERVQEAITRARDTLDCAPEELAAKAEHEPGDALPALDAAEGRCEKLKREREQLGGVNLRAEEEADECETRLTTLQSEKNDLEEAIARLRQGIGSLNKEGRERLLEAFERVNANFQQLFTSLFSGGEARLTLTESDDPLEAGLEILARPPGKKLQTMSLLSGGEQALTAMAMIFAVFLCNPAPICVLDEVDAPLDDANVERFCNLLDEMTRMTETRFLVITHHALTMSRMDRLVGVTMQERGVSQLVAVDLAGAERVLSAQAAE